MKPGKVVKTVKITLRDTSRKTYAVTLGPEHQLKELGFEPYDTVAIVLVKPGTILIKKVEAGEDELGW